MTVKRSPHKRRLIAMLAVLVVGGAGLAAAATGAWFTGTADVTGNAFTTGTVILGATPVTTPFTVPSMAPGDTVYAGITVANTGTLPLRYALSSVTTENVLASQLAMTIKVVPTGPCDAGTFGTGSLASGPGILGSTLGTKSFGDKAPLFQAGDRVLANGADEVLCAQVTLDGALTADSAQGLTTTAVFTFDAEQTTNH